MRGREAELLEQLAEMEAERDSLASVVESQKVVLARLDKKYQIVRRQLSTTKTNLKAVGNKK